MASPESQIVTTHPDPTEAVKEALTLAVKNLDDKLSQRLDSNDRAVALAREEVKTAARDLAKANADALDAALKTTGAAASKLAESFEAANKATNEKIDRMTERMNIWTGRDNTVDVGKHDTTASKGQMLLLASVVIAAATLVLALVLGLK